MSLGANYYAPSAEPIDYLGGFFINVFRNRIRTLLPLLLILSMGVVIAVNLGTPPKFEVLALPVSDTPTTKISTTKINSTDLDIASGTVFIGEKSILVSDVYLESNLAKTVEKVAEVSVIGEEITIYKISIPDNTQCEIWALSQENGLAYELVLAIYKVDSDKNIQIGSVEAEIEELVYLRDYWEKQNYSDEIVFDLMLLSRQRGIEGSIVFMKDNESYELDDYVQKVTEYKYYLNQIGSRTLTDDEDI